MAIRAGDDTTVYGTLATQGLRGAKGEQGDAGPGGGAGLTFNQSVSETPWVLVHNLNRIPQVEITVGGEQVEAEVTFPDLNTVNVSFAAPTTGVATVN